MGLYLLNISVGTTDPDTADLTFNNQESIIEIVVEKILGYENAIKEYDDNDTEDHNKKENVKINYWNYQAHTGKDSRQPFTESNKLFLSYEARFTEGFWEIDSPPPKI